MAEEKKHDRLVEITYETHQRLLTIEVEWKRMRSEIIELKARIGVYQDVVETLAEKMGGSR